MAKFPWQRRKAADVPASATPEAPRAIVAAATRITNDYGFRQQVVRRQGWQTEAVRQYDVNGELRFAIEWMANSLSRIRLTVNDVDGNGRASETSTKNQQVVGLVKDLLGDPTCVAQIMHKFGQNLGVTGDVYLVYFDERWLVLSVQEIADAGFGQVTIWVDGDWYELPLASTPVIRIYRPHPFRCIEANSPTRGALPVLRSIEELGKYRNATVNSRLAGAGILGIPIELSFAAAPGALDDEDPFMAGLAEDMLTPIADQSDPAAVIPHVIRGPKEFLPSQDNWLVSPASELTTVTADLMGGDIVRLATALDIPTEVLTGSQDSSRWATWQTEETAIKVHVEPLVVLICAALTAGFLKPLLAANGLDIDAFTIWFDATELTARPNRGADAQSLYDKGLLSAEATRRENGFSEDDRPQGEEYCRASVIEVLRLSPRFADQNLDVIAELMGWAACGITPELLKPEAPNTGPDGTPKQDNPQPVTPQDRPLPDGGGQPNG